MDPSWINLLVQVPLVGSFILFTILILDRVQKFIAEQNIRWQETLTLEHDRRKDAMTEGMHHIQQMTDSIEQLAIAVQNNCVSLSNHDAAARERHGHLMNELVRKSHGEPGHTA